MYLVELEDEGREVCVLWMNDGGASSRIFSSHDPIMIFRKGLALRLLDSAFHSFASILRRV